MMGMLSFMTDLPSEATEIMDRLNVTQSGPWVTVSFAATKAEIEDWARDLESAFQDMEW